MRWRKRGGMPREPEWKRHYRKITRKRLDIK
jgi:hypothetical protein